MTYGQMSLPVKPLFDDEDTLIAYLDDEDACAHHCCTAFLQRSERSCTARGAYEGMLRIVWIDVFARVCAIGRWCWAHPHRGQLLLFAQPLTVLDYFMSTR